MSYLILAIALISGIFMFNASINRLPVQTQDSKSYTVALVGDSMTESLGTADFLRDNLKAYYPDKGFGILNFGIGSTSILSVPDRLRSESKRGAETLPPVLDTRPDIILLESFGNNPLSQFPLEEGLKKQTETLDETLRIIKDSKQDLVYLNAADFIHPSQAGIQLISQQIADFIFTRQIIPD